MALAQAAPAPTDDAARRAAATVFADDAYDRSLRRTLLDRVLRWVGDLIDRLGEAAGAAPAWRWVAVALLVVLAVAILARVIVLARSADGASLPGSRARRGRPDRDPWAEARRLADAGDHTAAAHALYQALLVALARRERLRLHASRTVGDYGRALRARSSPLAAPYREFARTYEVVVYGEGHCDAARWERLLAMALPMLRDDAAPRRGAAA